MSPVHGIEGLWLSASVNPRGRPYPRWHFRVPEFVLWNGLQMTDELCRRYGCVMGHGDGI